MTQLYLLGDVDGALESLDAAIKRGYTVSRRDTALLGDAYLAPRSARPEARRRSSPAIQRETALEKARSDFEQCVVVVRTDRRVRERGEARRDVQDAGPADRSATESTRRVVTMRVVPAGQPSVDRSAASSRSINIELLALAAVTIVVLLGIALTYCREDRAARRGRVTGRGDPAVRTEGIRRSRAGADDVRVGVRAQVRRESVVRARGTPPTLRSITSARSRT